MKSRQQREIERLQQITRSLEITPERESRQQRERERQQITKSLEITPEREPRLQQNRTRISDARLHNWTNLEYFVHFKISYL